MRNSTNRSPSFRRAAALTCAVGLFTLGAAACGSDSKSASTTAAPTTVAGKVEVTKAWARTSPADAANGAAYFTIVSPVDDQLKGAMVDASVAKMAQMHETKMGGGMTGTTMVGATTAAPQMTMSPIDSLDLKAGVAVEFKPGGYHIMMMGLVKPLKAGDTITITLTLAKAGDIKVDAVVADQAP